MLRHTDLHTWSEVFFISALVCFDAGSWAFFTFLLLFFMDFSISVFSSFVDDKRRRTIAAKGYRKPWQKHTRFPRRFKAKPKYCRDSRNQQGQGQWHQTGFEQGQAKLLVIFAFPHAQRFKDLRECTKCCKWVGLWISHNHYLIANQHPTWMQNHAVNILLPRKKELTFHTTRSHLWPTSMHWEYCRAKASGHMSAFPWPAHLSAIQLVAPYMSLYGHHLLGNIWLNRML